jgi:3'-5' exoribonuclease
MNYKLIKELAVGEQVEQICLVDGIEAKQTKQSKPFTKLTIKDKSGTLPVNVWQTSPADMSDVQVGTYVVMKLKVEEFNGNKSAVAPPPMPIKAPDDLTVYQFNNGLTDPEAEHYYTLLLHAKARVQDVYIKCYLDVVFDNPNIKKAFIKAPASSVNRGAYRGGLVEHVAKVLMNAEMLVQSQATNHIKYPPNMDIIIASVLMHDIGKMYAYDIDQSGRAVTTRSGILLEHLPMSYGISVQSFIHAESILRKPIPEEIKDHINHCILAHHGILEYGSPVTPKSLEAHIVHMADMSDSTVSNFTEGSAAASNVNDQGFTQGTKFNSLKLYVGKHD